MYKIPKVFSGSSFRRGIAKIEVHPQKPNLIRFKLKEKERVDGEERVRISEGKCNREDCNEEVRDLIRPGVWYIKTSKELDRIISIQPVAGVFKVKVARFVAPEGSPPAPQLQTGTQWDYLYFTVILEITEGECKGMRIPYRLRYHFNQGVDEDFTHIAVLDHPKSKYTAQLEEFLEVSGALDRGAIPYKDNVLPILESRIKEAKKEFAIVLEDGYVKSVLKQDIGFEGPQE